LKGGVYISKDIRISVIGRELFVIKLVTEEAVEEMGAIAGRSDVASC